ncbi:biotin/lipoyl-containing protein [Alkaliflexus imshenetskii]|uniref:biotin/lipoyl-containing protein n=1 Tax=Alkaliflexus imshenetskii TaxID=286730 RepID=UPI000479387B|nr:biotin/lipoyl-containing protein [Alkaliflexus imshenetskii]
MKTTNTKRLIATGKNKERYSFTVKNRYEYNYKKEKLVVELIDEPDGFTILSCNGVRYPVEIVSRRQNHYEVLVNGVGYSFAVETPFSLNRNKLLASLNPGGRVETITSPMPGKVLDILVEAGQQVQKGEPLLILEAMKMQNSILSTVSGQVVKITVAKDENVAKGAVLIEIK